MCLVVAVCHTCLIFRPYIIVEKGRLLVKQHHISELIQGVKNFEDFLNEGKLHLQCWYYFQAFLHASMFTHKSETSQHVCIELFNLNPVSIVLK
jgi:hypothetical protein